MAHSDPGAGDAAARPMLRHGLAAVAFAALLVWWWNADFFGHDLIARTAAFVILCLALDFVAGYGGMVSLGHAALFGAGAYAFAALAQLAGWPAPVAILGALAISGGLGAAMGALVSRLHGIFLIMATLALGQIAHEAVFQSRALGGDDGMGAPRLDLSSIGVDLFDPATFSLAALLLAMAVYLIFAWLLASPFGRALVGVRDNERRMRAMGWPVRAHRTAAFGLSGVAAGLGGVLAAQQTLYITPELLTWTLSGEALVMVIFGGIGTLAGAVIGASGVVVLKEYVGDLIGGLAEGAVALLGVAPAEAAAIASAAGRAGDYWGFWLGALLIAVVLLGRGGVVGLVAAALGRLRRRSASATGDGDAER